LTQAHAQDNDGDGWDQTVGDFLDCDDDPVTGPSINPAQSEDGRDGVDEDCDGSLSIR
jgi:hypothetical protein